MMVRTCKSRWAGGIGALALAALVMGAAHAAPEHSRVAIAAGGKTTLYCLPLTIAERRGCFKDEGLEVEISDFPGGAKALQSLIGGSADVVSGAYEYSPDGVIPDKALKQSYQVLLEHNQAVRRAPVLFLIDTYTNAFVQQANKRFH